MATLQTTEDAVGTRRTARHLTIAVTSILVAIGVATAIAPDAVIALSRKFVSPVGIYVAAAVRCTTGLALLLIARGSRAPAVLRAMGVALVLGGIVFPFLGVESSKTRIEWEADHLLFLRLEGLLFIWGGFVIFKLAKPPEAVLAPAPSNNSLERTREG
jgi:cytochrome bd-type quinol oxidase subunit 2